MMTHYSVDEAPLVFDRIYLILSLSLTLSHSLSLSLSLSLLPPYSLPSLVFYQLCASFEPNPMRSSISTFLFIYLSAALVFTWHYSMDVASCL